MKTAVYIEDGVEQIVLTPESDFERKVFGFIEENSSLSLKKGKFYECQGGYFRQGMMSERENDFILRIEPPTKDASFEYLQRLFNAIREGNGREVFNEPFLTEVESFIVGRTKR